MHWIINLTFSIWPTTSRSNLFEGIAVLATGYRHTHSGWWAPPNNLATCMNKFILSICELQNIEWRRRQTMSRSVVLSASYLLPAVWLSFSFYCVPTAGSKPALESCIILTWMETTNAATEKISSVTNEGSEPALKILDSPYMKRTSYCSHWM